MARGYQTFSTSGGWDVNNDRSYTREATATGTYCTSTNPYLGQMVAQYIDTQSGSQPNSNQSTALQQYYSNRAASGMLNNDIEQRNALMQQELYYQQIKVQTAERELKELNEYKQLKALRYMEGAERVYGGTGGSGYTVTVGGVTGGGGTATTIPHAVSTAKPTLPVVSTGMTPHLHRYDKPVLEIASEPQYDTVTGSEEWKPTVYK